MTTKTKRTLRHVLRGVIFLATALLAVIAVKYLWNLVVPEITGWSEINFWQTLALMILGRALTGGFGGWRKHKYHMAHNKFHSMSRSEKKEYLRKYFSDEKEQ